MPSQFLFPGYDKPAASTTPLSFDAPTVVVSPGAGGVAVGQTGSPPAAPSDSTVALAASNVGVWAGNGHQYAGVSLYQTAISAYNFHAFKGVIPYLNGYGTSKDFKGSTAAGDSASGTYSLQRAFEGLASSDNGSVAGGGLFKAQQAGYVEKAYLGFYLASSTHPTTGLFGDMTNTTLRADVCTKIGNAAAFVNFIGGAGLSMDWELGGWDGSGQLAVMEAFGYEVGTAMWTGRLGLELLIYNWQPEGSWHEYVTQAGGASRPNTNMSRSQFFAGLARAHTTLNATGRIKWLDHFWYRAISQVSGVSTVTALKYNTQGTLAGLSRFLPAASWAHIAPLLDICCFHWANTDNTPFYTNTQENETAYTDGEELYRQWSMGGWRYEYTGPGLATDTLWMRNANLGLWNGHSPYTFPTGRQAKLVGSLASTSAAYSTAAPTISTVTASGRSGSNITLSFNAAHAYGIRCITYKVYASNGTTLVSSGAFQMTFDLNGGTVTTGITASRQNVSQQIAAAAGTYVVITAYSTLAMPPTGQQHSVVKAV